MGRSWINTAIDNKRKQYSQTKQYGHTRTICCIHVLLKSIDVGPPFWGSDWAYCVSNMFSDIYNLYQSFLCARQIRIWSEIVHNPYLYVQCLIRREKNSMCDVNRPVSETVDSMVHIRRAGLQTNGSRARILYLCGCVRGGGGSTNHLFINTLHSLGLSYLNFNPVEVVSRYRDQKFQVGKNYWYLFNLRSRNGKCRRNWTTHVIPK